MGDASLPDDDNVVNFSAADIRWTDEPPPRLEQVDVLALTEHEARDYTRDLQRDMSWLRRLLHEALRHLQILTAQLTAARVTIRELRRQERRS